MGIDSLLLMASVLFDDSNTSSIRVPNTFFTCKQKMFSFTQSLVFNLKTKSKFWRLGMKLVGIWARNRGKQKVKKKINKSHNFMFQSMGLGQGINFSIGFEHK